MSLLSFARTEVSRTWRNPRRFAALLDPRAWGRFKHRLVIGLNPKRIKDEWRQSSAAAGSFKSRQYRSYEQYLEHQKEKLEYLELDEYDRAFHDALLGRLEGLEEAGLLRPGDRVLCLAARIGTEVRAFIDAGCFAVGIDLNPGEGNRYVVVGDFHHIQFADASVDIVFCNALDHAFEIDRILSEVRRVLRHDGLFIVEALRGSDEDKEPEFYESFWWRSVEDLIGLLARGGFSLARRARITCPWVGHQLVFQSGATIGPSEPTPERAGGDEPATSA